MAHGHHHADTQSGGGTVSKPGEENADAFQTVVHDVDLPALKVRYARGKAL